VILAARARGRSFLAAVGAAAALGQAGCLRDAPLTDARCPCVDGYVCCASVDRCVRPDEICPGSTDAAPAPEPDASPSPLPPDAAPSLPDAAARPGPDAAGDAALADAAAPVDAAAGDAGTAFQIATFEPTEGPHTGGTVVDLTGAGFTPETRVRFGPYTAPDVTFLGADHLRVTTPPGAVDVPAVDVVVEVADRRAVAASAFRYVLPPMVEVTEAAGLFGGRGIGVVATDADGDGRRDLVTARTEAPLPGYWRALADLRFVPGVEGPGLAGLPYLENLVPVDLDATPPLEFVALRTWLPPRETLYVLDGVTGAAAARLPGNLEAVSSWDALVPFDVDGDGDIDLAGVRISPLFEANVTTAGSILRAEGGRLTAEPSAFAFAPGVRPAAEVYGLTAADLDADGFVDLLLLLDGVPHLHRGGPGGLRPQVEVWPLPAPDMKLGAPAIADLDADGGVEVLFGLSARGPDGRGATGTFVYRSGPDGFAPAPPEAWAGPRSPCADAPHPLATWPVGFGGVATGDVDLDGDLDLLVPVVSEACPIEPIWAESGIADDGTAFRAFHRMGTDFPRRQMAALPDDLDGDGDLDFVAHAWFDGERTRLYRNNTRENRGTRGAPDGGFLLLDVRNRQGFVPFGARVEVDLDGPAEAPDFAPGPGRLAVRIVGGGGFASHGDGRVHVGTGRARGPFGARVLLPDGPERVPTLGP
jgi:hypothetical protein